MANFIFRYYPHPASPEYISLEKKIFKYSLVLPILFLIIIWMVKIAEVMLGTSFYKLGVYPRHLNGLVGIITSPLIHANFKHLIANSSSFLVLSTALFFFYRKLAFRIFILNYLMSGIFLWLGGRELWHIGASGIIYGMAAFLLFSGIFKQDLRLLTISLIVIFLYGGLFWGLFPIEPRISWEGHLMGTFSGIILSLLFYKKGPRRKSFEWENETDEEEEDQTDDENQENAEYPFFDDSNDQ